MHKNVIEWFKDVLFYSRPRTGTATIVEINKHSSWGEPSLRVDTMGGTMVLQMNNRTHTGYLDCLLGYHVGMTIPVTYKRMRKTDEVDVLVVGAPCDS